MVFSSRFVSAFGLLMTQTWAAQAEGLPIELRWNGPAECGNAQSVLDHVKSMLGDAFSAGSRGVILAEATLQRPIQGRWELQLQTAWGAARGERSLVVADCTEAVHATALLLAFMIDPSAALPKNSEQPNSAPGELPRQQPTPPEPTTFKAPRSTLPTPSPSSAQVSAPVRTHFVLGLSGALDRGNLPQATLGGALQLGLRVERWSIELRPAAWLPSEDATTQLSSAGGKFNLYDLALVGCYRVFQDGALAAQTCVGPQLLHLTGRGYGTAEQSSRSALYPSALSELAILFDLSDGWAVRAAGDLLLALARPEYAIVNLGTVHRPARLAGRLALGFAWQF